MKVWLGYTCSDDPSNGVEKSVTHVFDSEEKAYAWVNDPVFKEFFNQDFDWRECHPMDVK